MELLNNSSICSICNYDNSSVKLQDNKSLLPNIMLANNKYLVGRIISKNGEHFTYLGYDGVNNKKVWITEFFPDSMAYRAENKKGVYVNQDDNFQFKTLKIDFSDLYSNLLNYSDLNGIIPVIDLFEENSTIYAISEYVESISLSEFLKQIGGSLNLEEASAIFQPFFDTILSLHMDNIIHKGISPETILIDKQGNLRLSGFSLSATRTLNSEINAELFDGYSAPEQYDMSQWQGTWTDVYSVCSVFYTVVTGIKPQSAPLRISNDQVVSLAKLNNTIPKNISYAIHQGMIVNYEHRTESIDSVINTMFYSAQEQSGETKLVNLNDNVSITPNQDNYAMQKRRKTKKSSIPYVIASAFMTTIILLSSMAILINSLEKNNKGIVDVGPEESSDIELETSQSDITDSYVLPNFTGQYQQAVEMNEGYNTYFIVRTKTEYSESVPKDKVISQDINAGTKIKKGETIELELTISKGQQDLPDMRGYPLDEAMKILAEKGLYAKSVEAYDDEIEKGKVIRVERGPNIIMVYYSLGSSADNSSGNTPGSIDEHGRPIDEDGVPIGPIVRD